MADQTKGYFESGDNNIGVYIYKTMLKIIYQSQIQLGGYMSDEIVLTETNNDAKFDTDTISNTCIIQEYTGNGFSDINAGYIIDTDGDAIGKVGVKTINKCVDIMFFCLKKLVEKETGYTG